jgi:hypothetical protein
VIVAGPDGAAIVTPEWHVLFDGGPAHERSIRLFTKPDDFFELADVANRCGDVAGPLEELLEQVGPGGCEAAWLAPLPETRGG